MPNPNPTSNVKPKGFESTPGTSDKGREQFGQASHAGSGHSGSGGSVSPASAAASLAEKSKEAVGNFGDKARETISDVSEKARDRAASMVDGAGDMACDIGHRAEDAVHAMGSGMQSLAGTIRERTPQGGVMATASSSLARGLESSGRYLEQEGLQAIGDDLTNIIRRNPMPAVLLGIGLGYLVARATRS